MFISPKQRTAASGDLLLAKAVLCLVFVVKADSVQGRGATNCVRREISILLLPTGLLVSRFVTFLSDCTF